MAFTIDEKVANCSNCGSQAQMMGSTGGFNYYYWVECPECDATTRGRGVMNGLTPLGIGLVDDAPQNSREEATDRWEQINSQTNTKPRRKLAQQTKTRKDTK